MQPLRWLTAAQAATWTGRPVGTIWRWASEGRVTRTGTGKNARYDRHQLPRKRVDDWTGEIRLGDPPPLPEGRRAA